MKKNSISLIITIFSGLLLASSVHGTVKELFELGAPQKKAARSVKPRFGAKKPLSTSAREEEPKSDPQSSAAPSTPLIAGTPSDTAPAHTNTMRRITITNGITKDMKTYKKHWSGHHTPAKFSVTINNEPLPETTRKNPAPQEPLMVSLAGDYAEFSYAFDFVAMGVSYRKGAKKLRVEIPQETDSLRALFSWDDPDRLIIQDAKTEKRLPTQTIAA